MVFFDGNVDVSGNLLSQLGTGESAGSAMMFSLCDKIILTVDTMIVEKNRMFCGGKATGTLFFDGGSSTNTILEIAAHRINIADNWVSSYGATEVGGAGLYIHACQNSTIYVEKTFSIVNNTVVGSVSPSQLQKTSLYSQEMINTTLQRIHCNAWNPTITQSQG